MKWYTLRWSSVFEGCQVEHFLTKAQAEQREREVRQLTGFDDDLEERNSFDCSYGITKTSISNGTELVNWLNRNYSTENG